MRRLNIVIVIESFINYGKKKQNETQNKAIQYSENAPIVRKAGQEEKKNTIKSG